MKSKTEIVASLIIVICIMIIGFVGLGFVSYRAEKDLSNCQEILTSTKDELTLTQNKLISANEHIKIQGDKISEMSSLVDSMSAELDIANTTIADLQNSEYEFVYMGDFRYTYYCDERYEHICGYGKGITASRRPTEVGWTVAADTSVLPMGSIIYVEGVGFREVMDVGGGVNGKHIDILLHTHNECFEQTLVSGGVWVLIKNAS